MKVIDHTPTVLLVEDDPNIKNLISIILSKAAVNLVEANDGQEALNVISRIPVNLIISDIMMPNMDGYAFRKKLLETEETSLIPFIFLTAKGKSKDIVQGMELNADDYIPKPFEPEVLLAKVKAILRRYTQFNELLQYDTLTQVFNRRTLEHNLQADLKRMRRYKQVVSIFLLDLDHFKNLNDTYGHDFGDLVLKKIAAFFKSNLRETDYIGRIGGEEFVVVMPNTDKKTAHFVANRLRSKVSEIDFEKEGLKVTLSGGISAAPEDAEEIEVLLKCADVALYEAKNKGRNCIVTAV